MIAGKLSGPAAAPRSPRRGAARRPALMAATRHVFLAQNDARRGVLRCPRQIDGVGRAAKPCERYHAEKPSVNSLAASGGRYRAVAIASPHARPASSMSASEWASETKAASNCEGARKTPRASMA